MKKTKLSVTNFIYCGEDYLFIKRKNDLKVMAGQVNGVGGKVENGEDYIKACIRETEEETGYKIKKSQIKFCGMIRFENDNGDDWVTCFLKIGVKDKNISEDKINNNEGTLLWIDKDKVLKTENIADDLNYIWEDVLEDKLFFLSCKVSDNNFQIYENSKENI